MSKQQVYEVTAPDGTVLEVTGPAGASNDEVISQAQAGYKPQPAVDPNAAIKAHQAAKYPTEAEKAARPKPERSFMNSLPAMGGGMAGAAAGATYGAGLGGTLGLMGGPLAIPGAVVGGALGGLAGAGLGAFGGEMLRQGTNTALGYENQFDPNRAAEEANTNMVGEMTGQLIGKAVGPVKRLLGSAWKGAGLPTPSMPDLAGKTRAALQSAAARKIPLTMADRTGSKTISTIESGVGRTMFGRAPIQKATEEQSAAALHKWWEPEILDQIAPHMDAADIGEAVKQALGRSKEKVLGNTTRMFDRAEELATKANVHVPDAEIRTLANEILSDEALQEAIQRAPSLAESESIRLLRQLAPGIPDEYITHPGVATEVMKNRPPIKGALGELINQSPEMVMERGPGTVERIPGKPTMPYATAEILRKAVQKIVRDAADVGVNIGRFKQLGGVIDDAVRNSLSAQSPEAYRVWESARQLYGPAKAELGSRGVTSFAANTSKQDEFQAAALKQLAKANPDQVVDTVMKLGLNGIEQAKKYLEFTPAWKQLQRGVLEKSMQEALTPEGSRVGQGILRGQHWQTQFNRNLPALKRILDKETMGQVEEFNNVVRRFRTAERLTGNASETTSASIAQHEMTTLAAAIPTGITLMATGHGLAALGTLGTAGSIVLGPKILAKILTRPGGAKLLTEALRVRAGTPAAAAISGRLLAYVEQGEDNAEPQR